MYNYALVPVELSLLCRLSHYGLDKMKKLNNQITPPSSLARMSIKTIKGRRRLWYEHMKGSITPLIKWAHSKKKKKSKAVESRATNTAISHFY